MKAVKKSGNKANKTADNPAERSAKIYALQNAVQYRGKAVMGAVIGKLFGEFPDLRKDAKSAQAIAAKAIAEVNKLSAEEQKKNLDKLAPGILNEKHEEKKQEPGLKQLKNAEKGKVVMRFEPSPSGSMHIGHSYPLMLNYEYCKIYDGKLVLRISDTNPDNIDPKAYKLLEEDFRWLCSGIKNEIVIQSDRMELYYETALKLLEEGHAYICSCTSEQFKEISLKKSECPCRNLSMKENILRWENMFDESKTTEGDAVLRLKTDMRHKNPAMRDFPLARISDNTPHARTGKKYRVWPLLNFAVAVDDHLMGMTHVLRGKDHYDNTKRQEYIFDYLKWKLPEYLHIGRINFIGLALSASETRKAIEKGLFTGWDDIRLPFIQALKRRGYQRDAFLKYAKSVGVTMVDKTVPGGEFFKAINAFNKEIIDPRSKRYFFIENPVEIKIKNAPAMDVELHFHPEHMKGGRKFRVKDDFYLTGEDFDRFNKFEDGTMVRLMDCLNFKKKKNEYLFDSADYEKYKKEGKLIIHWLPAEKHLPKAEICMPDGSKKIGLAEQGINKLNIGDIIQFERTGFCRLDSVNNDTFVFWFAHR